MTIEQKLDLLLKRQIVHTDFATVTVPAMSELHGLPIGDGKCIAVVLYLNNYVLNTSTLAQTPDVQRLIYYGNQRYQFRELVAGRESDIIFCKDLSDVYVRNANGSDNQVQVTIYTGEDEY